MSSDLTTPGYWSTYPHLLIEKEKGYSVCLKSLASWLSSQDEYLVPGHPLLWLSPVWLLCLCYYPQISLCLSVHLVSSGLQVGLAKRKTSRWEEREHLGTFLLLLSSCLSTVALAMTDPLLTHV